MARLGTVTEQKMLLFIVVVCWIAVGYLEDQDKEVGGEGGQLGPMRG